MRAVLALLLVLVTACSAALEPPEAAQDDPALELPEPVASESRPTAAPGEASAVELDDDTDGAGTTTGTWRPATPPPLTVRVRPAVVWTGGELVVVGGLDPTCPAVGPCAVQPFTDGAAYDPMADRWRSIRDLPTSLATDEAHPTTDGLVLGQPDGPLWRYDISEDRWNRLPSAPRGLDRLAVSGDRMVAYAAAQHVIGPPDHAFDLFQRHWRPIPVDPLGPTEERQMAWQGLSLVLTGTPIDPEGRDPAVQRAARLDGMLGDDAGWTAIPGGAVLPGTGWVPTEVGLVRADPGRSPAPDATATAALPAGGILLLDPDGVHDLPPLDPDAPEPAVAVSVPPAALGRTVVAGGRALDLLEGTWATITDAPRTLLDRSGPTTAAWAGDRVVVWDGAGAAATWQPAWLAGPAAEAVQAGEGPVDPDRPALPPDPVDDEGTIAERLQLDRQVVPPRAAGPPPGQDGRPDGRIDCADESRTRLSDTYPAYSDGVATPQQALHGYLRRQADHVGGEIIVLDRIHASILLGDREVVGATARRLQGEGWVPSLLTACGDVDLVIE